MRLSTLLAYTGPTIALGGVAAVVWGVAGADTPPPPAALPAVSAPTTSASAEPSTPGDTNPAAHTAEETTAAEPNPDIEVAPRTVTIPDAIATAPSPTRASLSFTTPEVHNDPATYRDSRTRVDAPASGPTGLAACTAEVLGTYPNVAPLERDYLRDLDLRRCLAYNR